MSLDRKYIASFLLRYYKKEFTNDAGIAIMPSSMIYKRREVVKDEVINKKEEKKREDIRIIE